MPGRTRLTTPPGEEPEAGQPDTDEVYSAGFALPREPRVASRWQRAGAVLAVLLLLAVGGYWLYLGISARQAQDPALTQDPAVTAPPSP